MSGASLLLLFEPTPLSVAIRSLFASGEQGIVYEREVSA